MFPSFFRFIPKNIIFRLQKDNEPKPIVLRKRRQRIKSEANWKLFYYHFNRDHAKPNLIWNFKVNSKKGYQSNACVFNKLFLDKCLERENRGIKFCFALRQYCQLNFRFCC